MRTMPNNTLNTDGPKACAFETGAVRVSRSSGQLLGGPRRPRLTRSRNRSCRGTGTFNLPSMAVAEILVFNCNFKELRGDLVITVYDDGSPARIGVEQGVGDRAQPYFDAATGAHIFVELNGVDFPITLTTILKDGTAWHSRHVLGIDGIVDASQMSGFCKRRSIH